VVGAAVAASGEGDARPESSSPSSPSSPSSSSRMAAALGFVVVAALSDTTPMVLISLANSLHLAK